MPKYRVMLKAVGQFEVEIVGDKDNPEEWATLIAVAWGSIPGWVADNVDVIECLTLVGHEILREVQPGEVDPEELQETLGVLGEPGLNAEIARRVDRCETP